MTVPLPGGGGGNGGLEGRTGSAGPEPEALRSGPVVAKPLGLVSLRSPMTPMLTLSHAVALAPLNFLA